MRNLEARMMYWHVQKLLNLTCSICILLSVVAIPNFYSPAYSKSLYIVVAGQDGGLYKANTSSQGLSTPQIILTPSQTAGLHSADFDRINNRIYWTNYAGKPSVFSADEDGSDRQGIYSSPQGTLEYQSGIAVDAANNHIYFGDKRNNAIYRSDLNGANLQVIVPAEGMPSNSDGVKELRLDSRHGHLYWSDDRLSLIRRVNLDGSNLVDLVSAERVGDIDLDLVNGKIYWTQQHAFSQTNGRIMRSNLDGTDTVPIVETNLLAPRGIAVDPKNNRIFWTDTWANGPIDYPGTIQTATLTGQDRQTLFDYGNLTRPGSLTLIVPEPSAQIAAIIFLSVFGLGRHKSP
jgi:DNA-binding beta-propeller fold protein YncE